MYKDPIIKEVADEFKITYEQAVVMYDQYWLEYVVKNLLELKYENIFVEGLGTYSAKYNKIKREIGKLKEYIDTISSETLKERYALLVAKLEIIASYVEESNIKRKNKRLYG